MTYTGPSRALYQEAIRLTPAIAAARVRGSQPDVMEIYKGFIEDVKAAGRDEEHAWCLLAAAMSVWTTQLFKRQADLEGREVGEVLFDAVGAAQDWVNSGAV